MAALAADLGVRRTPHPLTPSMELTGGTLPHLILAAGAALTAFPGPVRTLESPDRRYRVTWAESGSEARPHVLFVTGRSRLLVKHEFGRSVSVAWAPTSRALAVNDRLGSDGSTTVVYAVRDGAISNVCNPAVDTLGRRWRDAHHRYCDLVEWVGSRTLTLRLWGYGDSHSFDERVTVHWRE